MHPHAYRVDGEVGRFTFETYELATSPEMPTAEVRGLLFPRLSGKKWYRTRGFKELAYIHGSSEASFRKTSGWLNRVRHQPKATPFRTLKDNAEVEGRKLMKYRARKSKQILAEHDFSPQGTPSSAKVAADHCHPAKHLSKEGVETAIVACGESEAVCTQMRANPVPYEVASQSVNISIDDVGVKRQREHRSLAPTPASIVKPKARKYAYQTVTHVETEMGHYEFNAFNTVAALSILSAFLLHNHLFQFNLLFFADGQRTLHAAILNTFAWFAPIQLILDWYHLEEKCKKQLSLALKGRQIRNQVLAELTARLWQGLVDSAIEYLQHLNPTKIKDQDALDKLIGYLRHNHPHIPCYYVRKRLGLRNSSNKGEKSNDLLVSERQKHNGMSWSKWGSVALAAITTLIRNREYQTWFKTGDIDFKRVSRSEV